MSIVPSMPAVLESGRFLGRTLRKRQVGDLTLAHVRYTSGAAKHAHERPYFCLIRRGAYTERFARRTRLCHPSMLVFHPSGEQHAVALRTPVVIALNVEPGPEWLEWMRESDLSLDQPAECHGGTAIELAVRLFRAFRSGDRDAALTIESLTAEILSALAPKVVAMDSRQPSWLRHIPGVIDAHLRRRPSLRTLAAGVGVHPV